MEIMVVGARPEGDDVVERPREIISAVCVNSLEQPQNDPNVDSKDVEILSESAVQNRAEYGALSKDEDFSGMGVFSRKAERCGVLVVKFMDVLVENAGMERLMSKVMEEILEEEKEENLRDHGLP